MTATAPLIPANEGEVERLAREVAGLILRNTLSTPAQSGEEPADAATLSAQLSKLHAAARGCEFDLVPADGPIAQLALFMHEHGDRVVAALSPEAVDVREALHNLIVLARPYMRDEAQKLGLDQAVSALAALRASPPPVEVERSAFYADGADVRAGHDPLHQYAVVSSDYARPFLLGAYPTLDRALRAQDGKPHLWHIYHRLPHAALCASPPPVEAGMVPNLFWVDGDPEVGHLDVWDAIESAGGYMARGNVVAIREGVTLGVKHWATLPAADDSDSDDWWEFAASTHKEAAVALKAEVARRAMLSAAPKGEGR